MPAPQTINEFLDLAFRSGLVDEKRLTAYVEQLRAGSSLPAEPVRLAELLVRDGLLTRFQAEQIMQGKWKRFTIGKYKVLERLGSGGMGSVYLCEHMLMRRRVAVKVLPAAKAEDPAALERFYREARAVAALDHPNIVRAYDIDQEDKLHFLVMEHVDGASLQDMLKKAGPLEVLRAAHYIHQAALGLQHAHEAAGLVHRDIKPGNILVDRSGIVKILDMGLARFFHDEDDILTRKYEENVLGTADYLAPEQALDSHMVDIRADIYSLGATFYFCLTARPPFAEGSVAQKLIWHQTRQPRPIRSVRPDVPEGIAAIIDKMMMKDPAQRYQLPLEVAQALVPWTQTPIPPPPDSEMPQHSLAAMGGPTTGDVSQSARAGGIPGGERSPTPRRTWQVSGTSPGAVPQGAPAAPAAPGQRPASEGTIPIAPSSPSPTERSMPVAAARAPVATARPASAPRPGSLPSIPSAPAPGVASPTQALHQAETPTWEDMNGRRTPSSSQAELGLPPEVLENVSSASHRTRQAADTPWVWKATLVGILVLTIALGVLGFWYLTREAEKERPPVSAPTAPQVLYVDASGANNAFTTLTAALAQARRGDRIILRTTITESVTISSRGISLEAEEGKTVQWKVPVSFPARTALKTLLVLQNVESCTIKGISFEGGRSADAILQLYGKCPGLKVENCSFKDYTQFGIYLTNCEGQRDNPVVLKNLSFMAGDPMARAIVFNFMDNIVSSTNRFVELYQITYRAGPVSGKIDQEIFTDAVPAEYSIPPLKK